MIKKKLDIHIIVAITALISMPLLFQYIPSVDCVTRYAPMAEAFASGNMGMAFHSRFLPLFPILTGSISFLFGCSGYFACKFVCWILFWLSVYPVYYLALTIGQPKRIALFSGGFMAFCYPLMALIGDGTRANLKSFLLLCLSWAILKAWQSVQTRYLVLSAIFAAGLTLTRGDAALYAIIVLTAISVKFFISRNIKFSYQPLLAILLFILLLSPWLYFQYHAIGYPVPETRHAMLLDTLSEKYSIIKKIHYNRQSTEKKLPMDDKIIISKRRQVKKHEEKILLQKDIQKLSPGDFDNRQHENHATPKVADKNLNFIGNGDFDGNGVSDSLWRSNDSKILKIWYNGNHTSQYREDIESLNDWELIGIGDFSSDHKSDILWQNKRDGIVGIWEDGDKRCWRHLGQAPRSLWHIISIEDIIGDDKSDILWQNRVDGTIGVWRSGKAQNWQQLSPTILAECRKPGQKYDSILTMAKIVNKKLIKKPKRRFITKLFRGVYPLYAIAAIIGIIIACLRKKWHRLDTVLLLLFITHIVVIIGQILFKEQTMYVSVRYLVVAVPLIIPWATKAFFDVYILARQYIHRSIKYLLIVTYIIMAIIAYWYGVRSIFRENISYSSRTADLKYIAQIIRSSSLSRKSTKHSNLDCNFYTTPTILSGQGSVAYYGRGKLLSTKNISEQKVDFIVVKNKHNINLPVEKYKHKFHKLYSGTYYTLWQVI